ncbi:MFS transporter, partial [Patescibacteria group bacterium]|nr:MFS transporter [Patescibacteria group bacterium]
QIGFVGGNVFYDAFLPHIASSDKLDWVSGKGYAFGYIGGGIQFALSLGLIAGHTALGISEPLAARIAMTMAGLWWAGFSVITFIRLKEVSAGELIPHVNGQLPRWLAYTKTGLKRTIATIKKVRSFKHLSLYLIAFMIFNDGIQTVIGMATIYGKDELGFSTTILMVTLLIIQIVAIFGALLFGKLGEIITTKRALMITLILWSFVVIYAYFMTTAMEYFILGMIVGMVMGGSQALNRSLYSSMIPVNAAAEFFGFYSIFEKFSAIWGPLVFALIRQMTGTSRIAIVSLIIFFITGIVLLYFVNVEEAKKAKLSALF